MSLNERIREVFYPYHPEFSEKKGITTVELVIAERKSFPSRKKLTYIARYRIDDSTKEVRFTEMLKESGSGMPGADIGDRAGSGFKSGREGSIQKQWDLFSKKYSYIFDFNTIRAAVEKRVIDRGYIFQYQMTPIGL